MSDAPVISQTSGKVLHGLAAQRAQAAQERQQAAAEEAESLRAATRLALGHPLPGDKAKAARFAGLPEPEAPPVTPQASRVSSTYDSDPRHAPEVVAAIMSGASNDEVNRLIAAAQGVAGMKPTAQQVIDAQIRADEAEDAARDREWEAQGYRRDSRGRWVRHSNIYVDHSESE